MAKSLEERIHAARRITVPVGGWNFIIMRPTYDDMADMHSAGSITSREVVRRFVIGWEGVKELDVVPGGTGEPAEFSAGAFSAWVADQPELWSPLSTAILESFTNYISARDAAAKNSTPG